jgi:hypothetical protein
MCTDSLESAKSQCLSLLQTKLCNVSRLILPSCLYNVGYEVYSLLVPVRIDGNFIVSRSQREPNFPNRSTRNTKNRRNALIGILVAGETDHHPSNGNTFCSE